MLLMHGSSVVRVLLCTCRRGDETQLHAFVILKAQSISRMSEPLISSLDLLVHDKTAAITAIDATFVIPRRLHNRSEATYATEWQHVPMPIKQRWSRFGRLAPDCMMCLAIHL